MNADVGKLNGLAPRSCELCHKKEGVARCSACLAVFYCGRECQVKDRDFHKTPCTLIKKNRLRYESEEKKLREMPSGPFLPENVFEDHVGHFWGILETRPYIRARYALVDAMLISYGTAGGPVDVVQMSLDHLLDMMRLCRSDNLGLRELIPALYIRLGKDQDAYDFMKWYATTGQKMDYNWGDMEEPFLDTKDADVLEAPVKSWKGRVLDLNHVVAVVLIKVRIMLDLQVIQNARIADRGDNPEETIKIIGGQARQPYYFVTGRDFASRAAGDSTTGC
ncbi:MYND finger domain protein [Metarhizium robertsii]|uniref:MYND finger domain protein n=1 Tax=Metarhizium robertsii TaxID=568076 RepID=A0A0A1UQ62_9HYPO|nr:MYND finger domain protein [Metarhizium robertsii]